MVGDLLSSFQSPSRLPATSSHDIEVPGARYMAHSKTWWMQDKPLSGAAHERHSRLAPQLGGHSAIKVCPTASSISSSSSFSTSSSRSTSPGPISSATMATFAGLNRPLEPPSPPGTRSRYFSRLVQRPSRTREERLDGNFSSTSPSEIKLPWYFPSAKPPAAKKDIKDAFFEQPNLSSSERSPALGLGLAAQPLSLPSMATASRLSSSSCFVVPLPKASLSRTSSACSSWSSISGSGSSLPGTPLAFPGFSNSAVWSPCAAYTSRWPSVREIAASFGLRHKSQVGDSCDNALGLFYAEQSFPDVPLSSAYPGPPHGLPPLRALAAPLGLERLSLGSSLSESPYEGVEKVEDIKLCGPDVCCCDCDDGVVAGPIIREAPEIVHAGTSFKVTCMLGAGASARVVGAEHAGKRYAVKVIHKGAAAASGFTRGEYLRELEVFRRIGEAPEKHQFLTTLKMSWEDTLQDRIFFVMDRYPTDLFSVLSDGAPITSRDRQLYCQELISAVSGLRDLGIVHGDIKPSNVLIDARGRALLSDFGNAEDASTCADGFEFWRSHVLSGTPPYMAPEVAAADMAQKDKGYGYGASADVWSLGLVFLEIFGRFAGAYFEAWTAEDVRAEHAKLRGKGIELEKVPLFEMPRCFEILLDSMLQYYEELRPTVEELAEWNARPTNWEVSPSAVHDWMPLCESSWNPRDSHDLANFLSFDSPASARLSELPENPADFEYRAPEAFA